MRRRVPTVLALFLFPTFSAATDPPVPTATVRPSDGVFHSSGRSHGRPGPRITPTHVELFAQDNSNARFMLLVRYRGTCGEGVLRLGSTLIPSLGYGSGNGACSVDMELDAPQAIHASSALRVPIQRRSPIGTHVVGTFAPSQATYRPGQPVEIVLSLANPSTAPDVIRQFGGRQRGPRDNQFNFQITRDGVPVAPIEGWDLGGLTVMLPLASGASATLRAPLDRWGLVSARALRGAMPLRNDVLDGDRAAL